MEQLLLVTSCDSPAGIGASLRTHGRMNGRTNERTDGWTDRRDVGNSILDYRQIFFIGQVKNSVKLTKRPKSTHKKSQNWKNMFQILFKPQVATKYIQGFYKFLDHLIKIIRILVGIHEDFLCISKILFPTSRLCVHPSVRVSED